MGYLINQVDVLTLLHNQMGHRVAPGGTDDDLKRYVQEGFNYCWRYYKWGWSLQSGSSDVAGLLPEDFDLDGYSTIDQDTYTIVWDSAQTRLKLDPVAEIDFTYQITPPTLGTDAASSAPFPSAMVVAEAAIIYSKLAENPTRADVTQEWDMVHSHLDRLAGRSFNNKPRRPVHYLDVAGTYVGDVGA